MAANDWSNTTQILLTGGTGTQISFGDIRTAIGNTNAPISASEMYRQTDLDAPYQFASLPTSSGAPHKPYLLDSTENVGVPTSGQLSPDDIRNVIKDYVIEQQPNTEEEYFDAGTLSSPTTSANVNWNSNLNKNITKYLRIRGRMISNSTSTPALSIGSSSSSNLNLYVHNTPSGDGIFGSGGAKQQAGGNAINITNPGAPSSRVVFVECEGGDARIWAGGGGGSDGVDGVDGVNGSANTSPGSDGVDGVDGSDGSPGSPGSNGSPGNCLLYTSPSPRD